MATHETTIHPFPAQEWVAQTISLVDRVLSILDCLQLTTCDWRDEFCNCGDLGAIHCLETEEDLCSRHCMMRLAEGPNRAFTAGLKKRAASVALDGQTRRGFGD